MGGTLVASKAVNLHSHYKKRFKELGFDQVTITTNEKDGLKMLIHDLKPSLLLIESSFYKCCTPYLLADIHKEFPKLNIAAVSLSEYPDDLAMNFIVNGARSYVNIYDGLTEFYKGLEEIRKGNQYISPAVQKRIEMRNSMPEPARKLTKTEIEVTRLICNGFSAAEISDVLQISKRTIDKHKQNIFRNLNTRNENEVIREALRINLINKDELIFYGNNFQLNPRIDKKLTARSFYDSKNKKW